MRQADNKTIAIKSILDRNLVPQNRYLYGFADLSGQLPQEFIRFSSGISILRRLDDRIIDKVINGPTEEYYNHYKEVNDELYQVSEKICGEIQQLGIDCVSIKPSMQIAGDEFKPYFSELRYLVSHKMVATRAGLGWIGKSDLFISKTFGPRLRLTSILVQAQISPDSEPVNKSKCGSCNICVTACPAKAANGIPWDIHTDRNEFFNPWKCREKCTELGLQLLKKDQAICGICVAVCPVGKLKSFNVPHN